MSISTSITAWGIDTTSNEVAKIQIMSKNRNSFKNHCKG